QTTRQTAPETGRSVFTASVARPGSQETARLPPRHRPLRVEGSLLEEGLLPPGGTPARNGDGQGFLLFGLQPFGDEPLDGGNLRGWLRRLRFVPVELLVPPLQHFVPVPADDGLIDADGAHQDQRSPEKLDVLLHRGVSRIDRL